MDRNDELLGVDRSCKMVAMAVNIRKNVMESEAHIMEATEDRMELMVVVHRMKMAVHHMTMAMMAVVHMNLSQAETMTDKVHHIRNFPTNNLIQRRLNYQMK